MLAFTASDANTLHQSPPEVEAMLDSGTDRDTIYSALNSLYLQCQDHRQVIERDAVADLLDAFDGLCSPDSALLVRFAA